jgi:uncharacterized RDD family membrane protein YckC
MSPVAEQQLSPPEVRCPACRTTVTPVTGWCSHCMEPLPLDGSPSSSEPPCDFEDFDPYGADPEPGGQVIVGPWADRPVGPTYATWRQRAFAALIDAAVFGPALVTMAFSVHIGIVVCVAALVFTEWQVCRLQGRTGQTIGKHYVGLLLVREADLTPIGARRAALRQLAHTIDASLLGIGFLWPLWDAKHQTFADQVFATVVVVG